MRLDVVEIDDAMKLRDWRNQDISPYRTPYFLTECMQSEWNRQLSNRGSRHRYWSIRQGEILVAVGGLTDIQWENSIAEITLVVDPSKQGQGLGRQAVELILAEAFNRLNLQTVFGEVYACNDKGHSFWANLNTVTFKTNLPNRKYWDGKYWPSMYFSWDRHDYYAKQQSDF